MKRKILCIMVITSFLFLSINSSFFVKAINLEKDLSNTKIKSYDTNNLVQNDVINWMKTFGDDGFDQIRSVIETNNGDYIAGGIHNKENAWIVSINFDGSLKWEKIYKNEGWSCINEIQQTNNGDFILALNKLNSDTGWLISGMAKINSQGNIQWDKTYLKDFESSRGMSVKQTKDGGYIFTGNCRKKGASQENTYDIYILKTNNIGTQEWLKIFDGDKYEFNYEVWQTSDEGYIMGGGTNSFGAGKFDGWLLKLDKNGNIKHNVTFGGKNEDYFLSVRPTTDGGYIASGKTCSLGDKNGDTWLLKTDKNLNKEWEKIFQGPLTDIGTDVQQTSDEGYIIAGISQDTNPGEQNISLIKTDKYGNKEWWAFHGNYLFDWCGSVQETSDGGYILGGYVGWEYRGDRLPDGVIIKTDENGQCNFRPEKPSIIKGSLRGTINKPCDFIICSEDPNEDKLWYYCDWGDGTEDEWIGPYASGDNCEIYHVWTKIGKFNVRFKAKDEKGLESEWSDIHSITMPKSKNNIFETDFIKMIFERFTIFNKINR